MQWTVRERIQISRHETIIVEESAKLFNGSCWRATLQECPAVGGWGRTRDDALLSLGENLRSMGAAVTAVARRQHRTQVMTEEELDDTREIPLLRQEDVDSSDDGAGAGAGSSSTLA